MNRRAKVELFEQIRREYEHGAGTINGVARKLGIHRRLVREALSDAIPRERKVAHESDRSWRVGWRSLMPFWKRIGRRRASSDTRRIAFGVDCEPS